MYTQNRDFSVLEDKRRTDSWENSVHAPKSPGQSRTVAGVAVPYQSGQEWGWHKTFRSTDRHTSWKSLSLSFFLPMAKSRSKEECKSSKSTEVNPCSTFCGSSGVWHQVLVSMERYPGVWAGSPALQCSEWLWDKKLVRPVLRRGDGGRINGIGNG